MSDSTRVDISAKPYFVFVEQNDLLVSTALNNVLRNA
jgi:hypothetical protein